MTIAFLSPVFGAGVQLFDNSGRVLAGGKIYTYLAGTTTPAATYTTYTAETPNANPMILDSGGRPIQEIWLSTNVLYKFVVTDNLGNPVGITFDNISGINDVNPSVSAIAEWIQGTTPTFLGPTSFSVVGNQTVTYPAGRRIKFVVAGGTGYGTVVSSTYGAGPNTVVVITNDSTALDSGLSLAYYGIISGNPNSLPPSTFNTPTLGGVSVGTVTLDGTTPSQRVTVTNTNPGGWNTGFGRMTVDYQIMFNSFFSLNPTAHLATMLRCDTDIIATHVRGQGVAIGNLTGMPAGQASTMNPTPLLETSMGGVGGAPPFSVWTWGQSEAGRSLGVSDGVQYRLIIDTTKALDGNRYLRYRLYIYNNSSPTYSKQWNLSVDTGDVLDHNTWADLTKSGLVFAYVGASGTGGIAAPGSSISITDCVVTWGPAEVAVTDATNRLSRYGAELVGPLDLVGANPRISIPTIVGSSSLVAYATVQGSAAAGATAGATTLVFKPSGTSHTANIAFSNDSTSSTSYQAAFFGMNATSAEISTVGLTLADPVLNINIGLATLAGTFTATGLTIPNTLTLMGTAPRVLINYNASTNLTANTTVASGTTNTATNLVFKPNGSSTAASVSFVGSSDPSTNYPAMTVGVSGGVGQIQSFGLGSFSAPNIQINIGATIAEFSTAGISVLGASTKIGQAITTLGAGVTNWGGTNAQALNSTLSLDVDNFSVAGVIASFLTGTYTAANIETVVKPLWSLLSCLVADLKNKKVI